MPEPRITINGHELSQAQAVAVRVAITSFHAETEIEHRRHPAERDEIAAAYHARLSEVLRMIIPQRSETP